MRILSALFANVVAAGFVMLPVYIVWALAVRAL